ncbi:hypothetical protein, partial [Pseudomonas viridiflava]|uniref:hypothetical protein n=1 Tax=Pseudomonas viridiflava TaxID=33069 RepID=UPI00197F1E2A
MQDSVFVVGRVSVFVSRLIVFDLPVCGRRLAGDAASAVSQADRVIVHRRQAASYQTTCKPLKKLDFVGADRAAFRLSANTVF